MENQVIAQGKLGPVSSEHIQVTPGVCGGKPCIAGTRIRVQDVYVWHELQGQSPDDIVSNFPHITLADVHAALAYYWDHRDDIELQMKADDAFVEAIQRKYPSKIGEKLKAMNAKDSTLSS